MRRLLQLIVIPFYIVRAIFLPRPHLAKPNALRRIKKHFKLKSTSEAKQMLMRQDPRLLQLPNSVLDELNLQHMSARREKQMIEQAVKRAVEQS